MANVLVQESSLRAIADAIREKMGTQDTYTPAQMAPAIGELGADLSSFLIEPYFFDLDTGYVVAGAWKIGGDTVNYTDVYEVEAGKGYLLMLGSTVGTRFRAMFTTEDLTETTRSVTGSSIVNVSDPSAYELKTYFPEQDGYIAVTKDNNGHAGIRTYLLNVEDLAGACGE